MRRANARDAGLANFLCSRMEGVYRQFCCRFKIASVRRGSFGHFAPLFNVRSTFHGAEDTRAMTNIAVDSFCVSLPISELIEDESSLYFLE